MTGVLYDGWPLAYRPASPAALHLLALLTAHPADLPAMIALPASSFYPLPEELEVYVVPTPDTEWGRLRWEQRCMPGLAQSARADLVHLTGSGAALFGRLPTLVSPAGFQRERPGVAGHPSTFTARLRDAVGQGGLARARAWLWPTDLPDPAEGALLHRMPPAVHPLFCAPQALPAAAAAELEALHLPESYILYHGPAEAGDLRGLLAAWSWAAASIGGDYPLLLVGLDTVAQGHLAVLLDEYGLAGTGRALPPLSLPALAALYHTCSAVFHPVEPSPWGDAARLALAAARPLVGLETRRAGALAGPAAYLAPLALAQQGGEKAARRALGAALLTVIVEESMAEALAEAARRRAASWSFAEFTTRLGETYRHVAERRPMN
jgi:hypothetical protein